jgi:hypothetical protein
MILTGKTMGNIESNNLMSKTESNNLMFETESNNLISDTKTSTKFIQFIRNNRLSVCFACIFFGISIFLDYNTGNFLKNPCIFNRPNPECISNWTITNLTYWTDPTPSIWCPCTHSSRYTNCNNWCTQYNIIHLDVNISRMGFVHIKCLNQDCLNKWIYLNSIQTYTGSISYANSEVTFSDHYWDQTAQIGLSFTFIASIEIKLIIFLWIYFSLNPRPEIQLNEESKT